MEFLNNSHTKSFPYLFCSGLLIATVCYNKVGHATTKSINPFVNRPEEVISLARVDELYRAYSTRYEIFKELRRGLPDARFGWNSMRFYYSYINDLETVALRLNIRISGLRLYYAAHPDDESTEKSGLQAYILVPTYYDDVTGKHIPFDPAWLDLNGNPLSIERLIERGKPEEMSEALWERESLIGAEGHERRISLKKAHAMYMAYQTRFNALTELKNGEEDARYGWHDIEFYKEYIAYLETAAASSNVSLSGLRVYYAAYPLADDTVSRGYQTYFYIPTYYDVEKMSHIAIDPVHVDDQGKPLILESFFKYELTESEYLQFLVDDSSAGNFAQMCKPNCE